MLGAVSRYPHVLPQTLSCSPAIGQTLVPGGGMGPQCIHATWELDPGYELLLGVARGALEGTNHVTIPDTLSVPPVLSTWLVYVPQKK